VSDENLSRTGASFPVYASSGDDVAAGVIGARKYDQDPRDPIQDKAAYRTFKSQEAAKELGTLRQFKLRPTHGSLVLDSSISAIDRRRIPLVESNRVGSGFYIHSQVPE
jgi:hypothetical protein